MNTITRSSAFVLVLALAAGQLFAQNKAKTAPEAKKDENIIIRKKGGSNEKITVVIDGDKVTVNGKPVDDFKSDNVDILRNEDLRMDMPMAMTLNAPMPPEGGWKMASKPEWHSLFANRPTRYALRFAQAGGCDNAAVPQSVDILVSRLKNPNFRIEK